MKNAEISYNFFVNSLIDTNTDKIVMVHNRIAENCKKHNYLIYRVVKINNIKASMRHRKGKSISNTAQHCITISFQQYSVKLLNIVKAIGVVRDFIFKII